MLLPRLAAIAALMLVVGDFGREFAVEAEGCRV